MLEARSQGRPAKGDKEVGRTRLLERARHLMNEKPKVDLQRREIALAAGVTAALVSYYFPDKWDLVAAAGQPTIDAYVAEARAIVRATDDPYRQLKAITYLFLEFNFRNSYLLDFYFENSERMSRKADMVAVREVTREIQGFFDGLLQKGILRGDSPAFVQSALWGLCKHLAQQPGLAEEPDQDAALRLLAERTFSLFLSGAATDTFATD